MRFVVLTAVLLAAPVAALSAEREAPALAVVQMDRLLSAHPKAKANREVLRQQAREFESEKESMLERYEELKGSYLALRKEADDPALSDSARKERLEALDVKRTALREYEQEVQETLLRRQKEVTDQRRKMQDSVVERIREAIDQHARKKSLGLVLDASERGLGGVPLVLFREGVEDITDEILERIGGAEEPE